ncbi:MAG: PHP domain-containing protein [Oscillospiraceae bacterium]|jgi:predicted metal-dependent phosphoesterase TrpH|nr:PHP domain-containing protein [Oscillospiraceae bacterium]
MVADLHIHTYFSDGSQSPEEVVQIAKKKGLAVISVCDHDTVAAYSRLRPACEAAGIRLVQGVELDVYWKEQQVHLLAYNFDSSHAPMSELMQKSRAELDYTSVELIENMEKAGQPVSVSGYAAYEMPLGRGGWKGINYLLDKGVISDLKHWQNLYREYGGGDPDFPSVEKACRIIKSAGGIPVLAHPGNRWPDRVPDFPDILSKLKSCGIEGVECYHPDHTAEMTDACLDFCRRNDMRITCGGDGHGCFLDERYDIGVLKVDMNDLDLRGII